MLGHLCALLPRNFIKRAVNEFIKLKLLLFVIYYRNYHYYKTEGCNLMTTLERYLATRLSTHPDFLKLPGFYGNLNIFIPSLENWLLSENLPHDLQEAITVWNEEFASVSSTYRVRPTSFGEYVAELILEDIETEIFDFLFRKPSPGKRHPTPALEDKFDIYDIISSYVDQWYVNIKKIEISTETENIHIDNSVNDIIQNCRIA